MALPILLKLAKVAAGVVGVGLVVSALLHADEYPLLLERIVVATGFMGPARLIASKYDGPMYCTHRTSDDYARIALAQLAEDRPDVMVALMRDSSPTVAYSAISATRRCHSTLLVPELMRHSQSHDLFERTLALYSLASIGDSRARPILQRAFENGENDDITTVGGAGLILLGDKVDKRRLSDLFDHVLSARVGNNRPMASSRSEISNLACAAAVVNDGISSRENLEDSVQQDMMLLRLHRCIEAAEAHGASSRSTFSLKTSIN